MGDKARQRRIKIESRPNEFSVAEPGSLQVPNSAVGLEPQKASQNSVASSTKVA